MCLSLQFSGVTRPPLWVTSSHLGLSLSPQELLLFLQNLPTAHWDDEDISLLLAEAYRLKFAFADAPNHYKK